MCAWLLVGLVLVCASESHHRISASAAVTAVSARGQQVYNCMTRRVTTPTTTSSLTTQHPLDLPVTVNHHSTSSNHLFSLTRCLCSPSTSLCIPCLTVIEGDCSADVRLVRVSEHATGTLTSTITAY